MEFKIFKVTIICLGFAILNGYVFNYINNTYFNFSSNTKGLQEFTKSVEFGIVVLIAPFVETFLFQSIPNKLLIKFNVTKLFILVAIPSLVFSLGHIYHPVYMVMAFFGGLIINYYYIYCKKRVHYYFLSTVLFHALYNLYGFLFVM